MKTEKKLHNAEWLDLYRPTREELKEVLEKYSLDPFLIEEFISPSSLPRVESVGHTLYAILHFPYSSRGQDVKALKEIDFVVGKNFLITVHYEPVEHFAKLIEVEGITARTQGKEDGPLLFSALLAQLYRSVSDELSVTQSWIDDIERSIFAGKEKEMVFALSRATRTLLVFTRSIGGHQRALAKVLLKGKELFGEHFAKGTKQVKEEFLKARNIIANQHSTLSELRETNNSLLSTKQNEVMKTFTILAFITFPLTLFSSLFAIEAKSTPIVGHPHDFWIILGIMTSAVLIMFSIFRLKKWI